MSGDQGINDSIIIFYHEEMTEAKKIVLKSRGIKLSYLDNKNNNDVYNHQKIFKNNIKKLRKRKS